ncbi:MAG: sulfatase [Solirubrobacterales bacterium]
MPGSIPHNRVARRWIGRIAAVALLWCALAPATATARPNVVVVMTDDLDVASMHVLKDTRRLLAHRGTSFVNSFVTTPLCCPSRSTFMTGLYAHNHGVPGNDPPHGGAIGFDHAVSPKQTLAVRLQRAGYRTGYVGKYLNNPGSDGQLNIPPGWNRWFEPAFDTNYQMFDYAVDDNGRRKDYGHSPSDYQTDVLARHSLKFISESSKRRKPFFLMLGTIAPHADPKRRGKSRDPVAAPRYDSEFNHAPLPRPPAFNERNVKDKPRFIRRPRFNQARKRQIRAMYRSRLRSLLSVDDAVRNIVNQLKREHELNNTVLMFTSDNGFLMGEHRLTGKALPYDESIGVPLLIRGPGLPRGQRLSQIVGNIDLAPTILDLAGAPHGKMDGTTLLPLIRHPDRAGRRDLLIEMLKGSHRRTFRGLRSEDYMLIKSARDRHRKLGPVGELYDLNKDPHEMVNRYRDPSYRQVRRDLGHRLRRLTGCRRRGCR